MKARYLKNILDFFSKPSPCSVELTVIVAYRMVLEAITPDAYSLLVEPRNPVGKNLVRRMKGGNRAIIAYAKRFTWVRTGRFYNENMRVARTLLSMARSE